MKYLLILLLIIGCGRTDELFKNGYPVPKESDATFYPYLNSFEKDFGISVSVPVVFGSMATTLAGTCSRWPNGYREIQISKIHWIFFTEAQRETLVYHELGHCVLDVNHNDTNTKTGCPESIMRSYMMSSWEAHNCYEQNKSYYLQELLDERNKS